MKHHIEFTLEEADVIAAYRAHLNRFRWKRLWIAAVLALVVGAALSLLDGPFDLLRAFEYGIGYLVLVFVVVVFIVSFIRLWWLPRYVRRIYRQQVDLHALVSKDWDAERLNSRHANGTTSHAWHDFYEWQRTNSLLLLYHSEAAFLIIPFRSDDDRQLADDIVANLELARVRQRGQA